MIDYDLLIIATFLLLFLVILGGTVLLFPLSRKLGHLIEARTRAGEVAEADRAIHLLTVRLDTLETQLGALADRQEFLDRLLVEQRRTEALQPSGQDPAR